MRRVLAAVALVALLGLTGCAGGLSETGEPLTAEQAQSLAQARFQLSRVETFTAEVSSGAEDATGRYRAEVTVDTADHVAWGVLHRGPDALAVDEQIAYSTSLLAVDAGSGWQGDALADSEYAPLGIVFSLIADRPENAELLRQSDAKHLGEAELGGETLDVYRLPSPDGSTAVSRLWLDEDGAVRRLDAGSDSFVIELQDAAPAPRPDVVDDLLGADAP